MIEVISVPIKDLNIQNRRISIKQRVKHSIIPIKTYKRKIYCKIQVVNNIHRDIHLFTVHSMKKKSAISVSMKDFMHHHPRTHCLTTRWVMK